MNKALLKLLGVALAGFVVLLTGCLAPKLHTWQTPASEIDRKAWNWPLLSTNYYCRVASKYMSEAMALLQERRFVALEDNQTSTLAERFLIPKDSGLKAYLVRGVYFGTFSYAEVRSDSDSGGLMTSHATYDGEMLIPFARSQQAPTAFIVFLPRPPSVAYATAYEGGDGIFRGKDFRALDTRR